jgi:hypothetical protein
MRCGSRCSTCPHQRIRPPPSVIHAQLHQEYLFDGHSRCSRLALPCCACNRPYDPKGKHQHLAGSVRSQPHIAIVSLCTACHRSQSNIYLRWWGSSSHVSLLCLPRLHLSLTPVPQNNRNSSFTTSDDSVQQRRANCACFTCGDASTQPMERTAVV